MPDTNADTPDTFSGTVLFRVTKPTRYAARLLLWQWKQWLNRGADWNNPSVCPLVPQTSCLTKLNPSWCRAFRPVSLCYSVSLFFFFIRCLFLSFWLRPGPLFGSLGTGPIYIFPPLADSHFERQDEIEGNESVRTQKGGQKAELGERWNKPETES